jgi:hypothetical protein
LAWLGQKPWFICLELQLVVTFQTAWKDYRSTHILWNHLPANDHRIQQKNEERNGRKSWKISERNQKLFFPSCQSFSQLNVNTSVEAVL